MKMASSSFGCLVLSAGFSTSLPLSKDEEVSQKLIVNLCFYVHTRIKVFFKKESVDSI